MQELLIKCFPGIKFENSNQFHSFVNNINDNTNCRKYLCIFNGVKNEKVRLCCTTSFKFFATIAENGKLLNPIPREIIEKYGVQAFGDEIFFTHKMLDEIYDLWNTQFSKAYNKLISKEIIETRDTEMKIDEILEFHKKEARLNVIWEEFSDTESDIINVVDETKMKIVEKVDKNVGQQTNIEIVPKRKIYQVQESNKKQKVEIKSTETPNNVSINMSNQIIPNISNHINNEPIRQMNSNTVNIINNEPIRQMNSNNINNINNQPIRQMNSNNINNINNQPIRQMNSNNINNQLILMDNIQISGNSFTPNNHHRMLYQKFKELVCISNGPNDYQIIFGDKSYYISKRCISLNTLCTDTTLKKSAENTPIKLEENKIIITDEFIKIFKVTEEILMTVLFNIETNNTLIFESNICNIVYLNRILHICILFGYHKLICKYVIYHDMMMYAKKYGIEYVKNLLHLYNSKNIGMGVELISIYALRNNLTPILDIIKNSRNAGVLINLLLDYNNCPNKNTYYQNIRQNIIIKNINL